MAIYNDPKKPVINIGCMSASVSGGMNARKNEADIWRIMPPYFDQEKGADVAPFKVFSVVCLS